MLEHWLYGHDWRWWHPRRPWLRQYLWRRCEYCGRKERVEVMELRVPRG